MVLLCQPYFDEVWEEKGEREICPEGIRDEKEGNERMSEWEEE